MCEFVRRQENAYRLAAAQYLNRLLPDEIDKFDKVSLEIRSVNAAHKNICEG